MRDARHRQSAIGEIMTPRTEVDWIDINDDREAVLPGGARKPPRRSCWSAAAASTSSWAWSPKKDLLGQVLAGRRARSGWRWSGEPLLIHEGVPIFKVLELFKQAPVRLAVVVDEYGGLEGIVTQADLLEALAGDLPDDEGDTPDIVERDDGSLLIDGMAPVHGILRPPRSQPATRHTGFHTIAGFVLAELGRSARGRRAASPTTDWRFEVVDMDGRRIDKLLVRREAPDAQLA